ncbi:hypothetical protein D3C87_197520 [compost metagenome]
MKKLALVAFGVSLFAMTSCKKEYTCTCTVSAGGFSGSASTTIKDTKKKAKDACEKENDATTTCKIS